MTKLEAAVKKAARALVSGQGRTVESVRHVHPRAYVVAKPAPGCIVVAVPWMDGEPQCRNPTVDGQHIIRNFDKGLKQGDWCSVAYVVTPAISEQVALSVVKP